MGRSCFAIFFVTCGLLTATNGQKTTAELEAEIAALEAELAVLRSYVATVRPTTNCQEVHDEATNPTDGIFHLNINDSFIEVYCQFNDTDTDQHWLVFQRRSNGDQDFYLGWENYTQGFGNKSLEFWIGLDDLYTITQEASNRLRVVLTDFDDKKYYAEYSQFNISGPEENYKLSVSGYDGDAGDSLTYHDGMSFSTHDRDNDNVDHVDCATQSVGAWWYNSCFRANLNGLYFSSSEPNFTGILWYEWGDSPFTRKAVEMKIRPN